MAKTLYLKNAAASGSTFLSLQDGGSAPSTATTGTGWVVARTITSGQWSNMYAGVERAVSTFSTTPMPNGTLDNTNGNGFRTEGTLNGIFAAGTWTFAFPVIAVTKGTTQDGRICIRLHRGTNATGSGATQITSAAQVGSAVTDLTTAAAQTSTVSFNPGAITLTNEYLFVEVAWEITGVGDNTGSDVDLRVGTAAAITTTAFGAIYTVALNDTVVITDSCVKTRTAIVAASDTAVTADSATRGLLANRIPGDTIEVADAASRVSVLGRVPSDTVIVTDTASTYRFAVVDATDAEVVVDVVEKTKSNNTSASDVAEITDSAETKKFAVVSVEVSDAVDTTDNALWGRYTYVTVADISELTDSIVIEAEIGGEVEIEETALEITDDVEVALYKLLSIGVDDATTITDSVALATDTVRSSSDAALVTDEIIRSNVFVRVLGDTITLIGDETSYETDLSRSISDAVVVADDEVAISRDAIRSAEDSIEVIDAVAHSSIYGRLVSDTAVVVDTVVCSSDLIVELSDSILITGTIIDIDESIGCDEITIVDNINASFEIVVIAADDIDVTDEALAEKIISVIQVTIDETAITVNDSTTVTTTFYFFQMRGIDTHTGLYIFWNVTDIPDWAGLYAPDPIVSNSAVVMAQWLA